MAFKRRVKRSTVFSRTALLLLLLAMSRHDPSNFSAQTGRSLLLDPGVSPSLCFSAQSRGRDIPDPGLFLSLFNTQEITVSLCDLSKCYMLSMFLDLYILNVCKPCIVGRESSIIPFGIIGYDGLDMLLKYHEYITLKKVAEEKSWLERTLNLYSIYMFLWSHDVVAMLVKLLCIFI